MRSSVTEPVPSGGSEAGSVPGPCPASAGGRQALALPGL